MPKTTKSKLAAEILNGFLSGLTETWNEEETLSSDELSALSWAYYNAKPHLSKEDDLRFCESALSWSNRTHTSELNFFIRIMLGHKTK